MWVIMSKIKTRAQTANQQLSMSQPAPSTRTKKEDQPTTQQAVLGHQHGTMADAPVNNKQHDDCLHQLQASINEMTKAIAAMNIGITTRLDNLDDSTKSLREDAKKTTGCTNDKLTQLEKLLVDSNDRYAQTDRKLRIVEARLSSSETARCKLAEKVVYLENGSRMCNLLIDGKPESDNDNLMQYALEVSNHLTHGATKPESILVAHRIGKKPSQQTRNPTMARPRTIKVIFSNIQERNKVYYARASLKGSDLYKGVYLGDDVTQETRKAREQYRSVAALARSENCEVRMHDDGIVLNGQKFKLFESDSLPPCFSLAKAKIRLVNGAIYFHSEHAYLSNFYPAPILVDDVLYMTAEHRFQALKCDAAHNQKLKERVIRASTPQEAKKLGDSLDETPEWRRLRDEVLTRVVDDKFNQNQDLSKLLLSTGDKKLYEATTSRYYGIGATLHSREVRDGTHTGSNKLGQTLEAKRAKLRATELG